MKATMIRKMGWGSDARLYRFDPPLVYSLMGADATSEYGVISATVIDNAFADGEAMLETGVFPSDADGEASGIMVLTLRETLQHSEALAELGYSLEASPSASASA